MIAQDFAPTPLLDITGWVLSETESEAYQVPFDAYVDRCPRRILAVLQRTVVYEEPNGDRFVATFDRVLVDPTQLVRRDRKRRIGSKYGGRVASRLPERTCRWCQAEFQPLQGGHQYCSPTCQRAAWEARAAAARANQRATTAAAADGKRWCNHCKEHKDADAFRGLDKWCGECRSEYNRMYHQRHAAGGGIMSTVPVLTTIQQD